MLSRATVKSANDMVKVYCKNTGTYGEFEEGTTLLEMVPHFNFEKPWPILSARVNNVAQGLRFQVYNNRDVEFLDYTSYSGRRTYCRSLCFLLFKAAKDLFPDCQIIMRRPISKGYYCTFNMEVSKAALEAIVSRMRELVAEDLPFYRHEVRAQEALELFRSLGYEDKAKLTESTGALYVDYYTLGNTVDYYYDALVPSTSYLKIWKLEPYRGGILLRVPDRHSPDALAPFIEQPKTFDCFLENIRWNSIMELENVGDVNVAIREGKATDLIQIAEALQEKKIVQIAEEIDRRCKAENPVRVVLITGPSSSGKSTFCKRLSIQLKACGLHPLSFSTDDYFVNRVETPKLPDGSYDFDNFDTVDHRYLQSDLLKMLDGKEVEVPTYNFVTGLREYNNKRIKLGPGTVLLVEGIHALNPQLTDKIPESEKFRIFINTITSISLDDHNCIPTSDNRLLRRIIRDSRAGSFTPMETIVNWPNVRRAETKWIYPYQELADVLFNSAYLVEFAVLRPHAEQILRSVPKNCKEYAEARRLLKFLSYFTPVSDKQIPSTSLIRSFIGGSSF